MVLCEVELVRWGERIGREIEVPTFLGLRGQLGAGKSVLARAVARGAGVEGPIPSPTFNLLFRYPSARGFPVLHLDLYRVDDPAEIWELGWEELGAHGELILVEWPERAGGMLPADRWEISLRLPDGGSPLREVSASRWGHPPHLPGYPVQIEGERQPMMTVGSVASEGVPRKAPLILAIETSGRVGSVALGERPVEEEGSPARVFGGRSLEEGEEQASLLLPRIRDLLEEVGVEAGDLSGLIVGAGPGSFTGVRVGVATAKGMARALEIPLWAFSSLAAAAVDVGWHLRSTALHREAEPPTKSAFSAWDPARPRCVLFDARGSRVYAAAYRVSGRGIEVLLEPRASTVEEMGEGLIPPGAVLMGDGALKHKAVFEGSGLEVLPSPAGLPTAAGHLLLLALDPRCRPLEDPGGWEPEYLRASGAERMHEVPRESGSR